MSDSDDDLLPNNVFPFQNENTTIYASGPNINKSITTGYDYRNNILTTNMPVNFKRQRYAGSNFDQRSICNRREVSPMSLRSVPDMGPNNFNYSNFRNAMGFQRSLYSRRGRTPATASSIDSTATIISAADIVSAFETSKFNDSDWKMIKDAYNRNVKLRQRKRIEKRRNLRFLMKRTLRRSGEDSGERASNSSMSSDDCRTITSEICNENIPNIRQMGNSLSHFRRNMRENPIFIDCTENIKQNSIGNIHSVTSSILKDRTQERPQNTTVDHNKSLSITVQSTSVMTQKERFKKGFLLPSQRFNRTNGKTQVGNNNKIIISTKKHTVGQPKSNVGSESESDQDYMFPSSSKRGTQLELNVPKKRPLENDNLPYSNNKRSKIESPKQIQTSKPIGTALETDTNMESDEFVFTKPKMPIKKASTKQDSGPKLLLSHITAEGNLNKMQNDKPIEPTEPTEKENNEDVDAVTTDICHSSIDVSTRPSFIKRKLYTQTLDVVENKNLSYDSSSAHSFQNAYSAFIKDNSINKARKLVTSQSCLRRELPGEDSNVLDLIHKIVPPNQINITNVTNRTEFCNESNNVNNSDQWDVTTAISNCNNQDSDTYTDEEIFSATYNKNAIHNKVVPKKSMKNAKGDAQCQIVIEKLNNVITDEALKNNNVYKLSDLKSTGNTKKSVTDCVNTFWDTDFETDTELHNVTNLFKTNREINHDFIHNKEKKPEDKTKNTNKATSMLKSTILTVRNCKSTKSQKNQISNSKSVLENTELNSIVQDKINMKVTEINKVSNIKLHTGKKKSIEKENVLVSKQQESEKKSKAKHGANNIEEDKQTYTSSQLNRSTRFAKKDFKNVTKNSINIKEAQSLIVTQISEHKGAEKITLTKRAISEQNNDANTRNQIPVLRVQPKRKSKSKSFVQSFVTKTKLNKTNESNINGKSKSMKQFTSKNTSLNSICTRSSRHSKEKLSFNSSSNYDQSNGNISNISNRSLRLRQRKINELYKFNL